MAVTARQAINLKWADEPVAFPVKSGETIYQGTFAGIGKDGYLYAIDSTACPEITMVGIVADDTANASGDAATTSSGSISGTREQASADAGDKTVRRVYLHGEFLLTFTSITQAMVGTNMYATDNYTLDDVSNGTACIPIGTLITYISATSGWLDLNNFYLGDGLRIIKGSLTASTGGAGGVFNVANPTGKVCLIEEVIIDITTGSSAARTIDVGIAATLTSSDVLIDGAACSAVTQKSISGSHGTNGGIKKWSSSLYCTATLSGVGGTFAGKYAIMYRLWV